MKIKILTSQKICDFDDRKKELAEYNKQHPHVDYGSGDSDYYDDRSENPEGFYDPFATM